MMKTFWTVSAVLGLAGAMLIATAEDKTMKPKTEFAVVGGGCFWCIEAVFEHVPGVKAVVNGYAGGRVAKPTYEQVCTGTTGHAEVVRIEYDPARVTYLQLLDVFWQAHDPTTANRQGPDEGTQYRSIVLYASEAQKAAAEQSRVAAQARLPDKIATEIVPLTEFFPAEDYHQDYFRRNPDKAYCQVAIKPKVTRLQQQGVIVK
jgi:peptide-methionine (S)-S-oxide reductase